jgi:hypothetical protein
VLLHSGTGAASRHCRGGPSGRPLPEDFLCDFTLPQYSPVSCLVRSPCVQLSPVFFTATPSVIRFPLSPGTIIYSAISCRPKAPLSATQLAFCGVPVCELLITIHWTPRQEAAYAETHCLSCALFLLSYFRSVCLSPRLRQAQLKTILSTSVKLNQHFVSDNSKSRQFFNSAKTCYKADTTEQH